jgi:hypothetical protein
MNFLASIIMPKKKSKSKSSSSAAAAAPAAAAASSRGGGRRRGTTPAPIAPRPPTTSRREDEANTAEEQLILDAFQTVSRQSASFIGNWFETKVWVGTMKGMFPELKSNSTLNAERLSHVLQKTYKDMDQFAPASTNKSGIFRYTTPSHQTHPAREYFCVTTPGFKMNEPTHLDPSQPPAAAAAAAAAESLGGMAASAAVAAKHNNNAKSPPGRKKAPPPPAPAATRKAPPPPAPAAAAPVPPPPVAPGRKMTLTNQNTNEFIVYALRTVGYKPHHINKFFLAEVWCNFIKMEFPELKSILHENGSTLVKVLRSKYADMGHYSPRRSYSGIYEYSFTANTKVFTFYRLSPPEVRVSKPTYLESQPPPRPPVLRYTPRPDLNVVGNEIKYPPGALEQSIQLAVQERNRKRQRENGDGEDDEDDETKRAAQKQKEMYDYWYSGECRRKFQLHPSRDPREVMRERIAKLEKAIATPDGWREILQLPYPNSHVVESEIFATRNKAILLRRLYIHALEKLPKELSYIQCCEKALEDCKMMAIPVLPLHKSSPQGVGKINKQFLDNGEKFNEPKKSKIVKPKADKDGPPVIMLECPELRKSMVGFGLRAIDTRSLTIPKMHKHVLDWLEGLGKYPPSEEAAKAQEDPPSPDTVSNWMKRIGFVCDKKKWSFVGDVRDAWK